MVTESTVSGGGAAAAGSGAKVGFASAVIAAGVTDEVVLAWQPGVTPFVFNRAIIIGGQQGAFTPAYGIVMQMFWNVEGYGFQNLPDDDGGGAVLRFDANLITDIISGRFDLGGSAFELRRTIAGPSTQVLSALPRRVDTPTPELRLSAFPSTDPITNSFVGVNLNVGAILFGE